MENRFGFIGNSAFSRTKNVKSVSIPESVTRISYNAFYYAEDLERINIPSRVTTLEESLFYRMLKFKRI